MSNVVDLTVQSREKVGTANTRRLRREGKVPAVVYGMGGSTVPVTVEPKALGKIINSEDGLNTVVNLQLEGTEETRHVMIKDMERHPINNRLTHVDFVRIDMDKKVHAQLPLVFTGDAEGTKLGGLMTIVRHELEVICLPKHLRGNLKVDISALGINSTLRIGDLPEFEGIEFVLGPTRTLVTIRPQGAEAEADEEEDDAA